MPVAWVNLEKAGNSNALERKALLERVLNVIPATRIQGFAADREFIGEAWFLTLLEAEVNPVIRIRADTTIQHRLKRAPAWVWFNTLKSGEVFELGKARVMGIRVFVIGTLTQDGEHLLLVTMRRPSRALGIYARRWGSRRCSRRSKPGGSISSRHAWFVRIVQSVFLRCWSWRWCGRCGWGSSSRVERGLR